jgi:hypothetical protein
VVRLRLRRRADKWRSVSWLNLCCTGSVGILFGSADPLDTVMRICVCAISVYALTHGIAWWIDLRSGRRGATRAGSSATP